MDNLQASMERTTLDDQASRAAAKTWSILCSSCRRMFSADFESWDGDQYGARGIHHTTAIECKQAAEAGCSICHTVWQSATQYGDLDVLALDITDCFSWFQIARYSGLMGHQGRFPEDSIVLNVWMGSITRARRMEIRHRVPSDSVLFALQPASLHPTLLGHEILSESTSSKETWNLLEGWMAHCRENCKCLHEPNSGKMSSMARILDVGAIGDPQIHLRSRAQLDDKISYITLSHCWGGVMACRLYDPNLEWQADGSGITLGAAANGIKVDALPKTFQDVVDVTRRLGVKYLWIDSLCIIQNSKTDWKRESFGMGLLYAGAYLTLAADGARNSSEGLFYDRKAASVSPLVLHCSQYKERLGDEMFVLLPADFWRETVSDSNLGRRAWCMQERVLSNAVIHFGRRQVAWECKGSDFCETFPKSLPAGLQDENTRFISLIADTGISLKGMKRKATTRAPIYESSDLAIYLESSKDRNPSEEDGSGTTRRFDVSAVGTESLDKYYIWSRLVEKYSRTNITFDTDRLVAVFGLAMVIGALSLNDGYIAGTWKSILPSQLVWSVDAGVRSETLSARFPPTATPSQPQSRRPSMYNAPSWSWAAVKAPILMPIPLRAGALIEAVHFSPKELEYLDDGFHETTFLSIKGNLHPGELHWSPDLGMWLVLMDSDGFGDTIIHKDDGVPRSADQGHAMVELVTDIPQADKSDTDTASSSNVKSSILCGIAQLDSSDDIDMGGSSSFPIICLPVIDTRSHRKHALHPDVINTLTGVSGLLLGPAVRNTAGSQGFYKRVGVFSLFGETLVRLRIRSGPEDMMKRLFCADAEDESGWNIILT